MSDRNHTHLAQEDRGHAVVVGASLAGLLAARVLSDHFDRITLIEKDRLPSSVENRQGLPQGRHAHGLLASGFRVMKSLFPGLQDELVGRGAVPADVIGDAIWYLGGSYKLRYPSGLDGIVVSRPLLEATIRNRATELPQVSVVEGARVRGLSVTDGRVTGVRVEPGDGAETADLVVDATGRGARTPGWLESLGYRPPVEENVEVGIGYTTRMFRRRPGDLKSAFVVVIGVDPPAQRRLGVVLAMEGDRWMVTLGGFLGDHAPAETDGFTAFAKSLSAPDIYEFIRTSEPVSDFVTYKFPANQRRRYDRLERFPDGYLVIGDGLSSFNPIYGQGMSVAALQAEALGQCLQRSESEENNCPLWRSFFARAAQIADIAWTLAATADFAIEGVKGRKSLGFPVVNWHMGRVQNLASRDESVCRAFFDVSNLLASPTTLFAPRIALKVFSPGAGHRPATV